MSLQVTRFRQILREARSRQMSTGVDTTVVAAHLAQMRLFMLKQGIEFYAAQDTYGMRREFIRRLIDYNELPGKLDAVIDNFLCGGRGIWFARPSKDLYRLHYFTEEQYRTYYDEDESLEELQIKYAFRVRTQMGSAGLGEMPMGPGGNWNRSNEEVRWMLMRVYPDRIIQTISTQEPQFDSTLLSHTQGQTRRYVNSLGFIPAVEVFNNRGLNSGEGRGEFDWLASHILEHDRMARSIRRNLTFFGGPTLVSSRPKSDLMEPDGESQGQQRATVASNSGFVGLNRGASRTSDPGSLGGEMSFRVPRIIANVESADRVAFITPDPVPGDLTNYTAEYQEMIRTALGGVDDLSISAGATAYEVRTVYGRVNATAKRKCRDLFEYGLCRLLSMLILNEERLFRDSFSAAIGLKKPAPVIREDLPPKDQTPERVEQLQMRYMREMQAYMAELQEQLRIAQEKGELPPGLVGLIPDGDTKVDWRWMGEVFPDGPQEILQNSMVCRNLQELGVGSIEALRQLYPEKTPEEVAAMLSGMPFRVAEATQRTAGIFLDLLRGMYQVPHPQYPGMPLAADPQMDLTPFLLRTLSYLQRELSYSGTFHNADPASLPTVLSDADRTRSERGQPTELELERERRRRAFADAGIRPGLFGLAGGVPGSDRGEPVGRDTDAIYGGPDGALAFDPANPYPGAGGQLGAGTPGAGFASRYGGSFGPADLLAPTNAIAGGDALLGRSEPAGRLTGRRARTGRRAPVAAAGRR